MSVLDDLEQYGKRYSHYVAIVCPYHDDHNPSLFAYEDHFYCAACGKRGKLPELLAKLSSGNYVAPVKRNSVSGWFGRWLREQSLQEFCDAAYENLRAHSSLKYYLVERGIEAAIEPMRIGYWDGYYVIPVKDQSGEVVSAVARAGDCTQERTNTRYLTYSAGLFSPDWLKVRLSPYVILPFGIIDAIVAGLAGHPAISNLTGKSPSPSMFDSFRKTFYIIPDKGEEKNAFQLARELSWRGKVVLLDWPDKTKDIADIWKSNSQLLMEMLDYELARSFGDCIRTDLGWQTIPSVCTA